jgi:hypothetical protein
MRRQAGVRVRRDDLPKIAPITHQQPMNGKACLSATGREGGDRGGGEGVQDRGHAAGSARRPGDTGSSGRDPAAVARCRLCILQAAGQLVRTASPKATCSRTGQLGLGRQQAPQRSGRRRPPPLTTSNQTTRRRAARTLAADSCRRLAHAEGTVAEAARSPGRRRRLAAINAPSLP